MIGLLDFEGQLVMYRSYHQDRDNVWWHVLCVPLLLFGITLLLTSIDPAGHSYAHCDAGMVFAVIFATWYSLLNTQLGPPIGMVWIAIAYFAKNLYSSLLSEQQTTYIRWVWGFVLFGWLGQVYSHIVDEHRLQTVKNNSLQTMCLSPLLVLLDVMFAFGYKQEVKEKVEPKAEALAAKYEAEDREEAKE